MTNPFSISPNLALDQEVTRRLAEGEDVVHLGFGESRLPLPEGLVERLTAGAHRRRMYGPVAGHEDVRAVTASYFKRRRLNASAEQVVLAPGSKPLFAALAVAGGGDIFVPRPCWVTYRPQAELLGRRVHAVSAPESCGGVPDPDALRLAVRSARSERSTPASVILTIPDNPTGTIATSSIIREICAVAEAEQMFMVSDEIYRDLVHEPNRELISAAEIAPGRTVVTTGLSKSLSLGGWRIGAALFPNSVLGERLRARVLAFASEVWSTMSGPAQEVAAYAFDEPSEIRQHVAFGARLHGALARATYDIMTAVGAQCQSPTAGFYVYPDFEPIRARLERVGVVDSYSLQSILLKRGIAVLGGHHFGDDDHALRFRAATSLLCGDTDEDRWVALESTKPQNLPHIAKKLARIHDVLHSVVRR